MARRLRRRAMQHNRRIEIRNASPDQAGIPAAGADAVVCTLVLCTVTSPVALLGEVRRILRPGGVLVVVEHVRHHNPVAALVQRALTSLQRVLAGGCCLDRPTVPTAAAAGFDVSQVRSVSVLGRIALLSAAIAGQARVS